MKQDELGKEPKFGHAQTIDIFIKELILHGPYIATTKIDKWGFKWRHVSKEHDNKKNIVGA